MTSRQRVYRSLDRELKGRVPRQLWTLPWAKLHHGQALARIQRDFPDDIVNCPGLYRNHPRIVGDAYTPGGYVDEWNCKWINMQAGLVGEIKEALIADINDLRPLVLPEELLSVDRDRVNDYCRNTEAFVLQGSCARPFERLQFLRTSENLYLDLAEGSDGLMRLIDAVHRFYLKEMDVWSETRIDALFFMDDWGAQRNLLISPAMWRRLFKPLYKDYVDLAHGKGKRIFMHSDGHILDILPDLIEIGVDAVNSQIFCMGLENLAEYRGRLCFWGEMDRQYLLPRGTRAEIESAVRDAYETLYDAGGVIAQCEFGAGADPGNVYTVFETWDELTGAVNTG